MVHNEGGTMSAINKVWVLAGHAIFTVQTSPAAQANGFATHYTFKVERAELKATERFAASTKWFVRQLTGPDNTSDYSYLGMLDLAGDFRLTGKSTATESSKSVMILRRVLRRIWSDETDTINVNGWAIHHAGCCGRCGALLTVPESVETGYGPECVKRATGLNMKRYIEAIGATVAEQDAAEEAIAEREAREPVEAQRAYENRMDPVGAW
jgi:hypothetical protein